MLTQHIFVLDKSSTTKQNLPLQVIPFLVRIRKAASAIISGLRDRFITYSPPNRFTIAAVPTVFLGHRELTTTPLSLNSSARPIVNQVTPYLAIEQARWCAIFFGSQCPGGIVMLSIFGDVDLMRWGRQYLVTIKVPFKMTSCIISYCFIDWSIVLFQLTADALLMSTSIPPKVYTTLLILALTWSSYLMSHCMGRAFPPALMISYAAVLIVPGNLGCLVIVLARMAMLAPSCANLMAMASPMPLDAPVITMVLFRSGFDCCWSAICLFMSCNLCIYLLDNFIPFYFTLILYNIWFITYRSSSYLIPSQTFLISNSLKSSLALFFTKSGKCFNSLANSITNSLFCYELRQTYTSFSLGLFGLHFILAQELKATQLLRSTYSDFYIVVLMVRQKSLSHFESESSTSQHLFDEKHPFLWNSTQYLYTPCESRLTLLNFLTLWFHRSN